MSPWEEIFGYACREAIKQHFCEGVPMEEAVNFAVNLYEPFLDTYEFKQDVREYFNNFVKVEDIGECDL